MQAILKKLTTIKKIILEKSKYTSTVQINTLYSSGEDSAVATSNS
jgi:hypothetical protein